MSYFNHRGIFLQKLGPTPVDPDEVLVSMQFAQKQSGWDAENAVPTDSLLDSRIIIASSYDGGETFDVSNEKMSMGMVILMQMIKPSCWRWPRLMSVS